MKNLRDFYSKIKSTEHLQNEVRKAKETFEIKPFVKEFQNIKLIILIARPLLSIFSIITGLGYLYFQIVTSIGVFFACLLSIGFLLFVELLKNDLALLAFKRLYTGRLNSLLLFLFLGLGIALSLSIFLSVQGAKDIYKSLDTQTQKFTNHSQSKKDSIVKYYDTQIKNEKNELANFKNSVSYNGKINVYDKTTSTTIDKHTQTISNLQSQKSKELESFSKDTKNELATINDNVNFNIYFWLVLSLTIECLIILSLWFLIWFDWCVSLENEILQNETFTFTKNDLQTYFNNRISNLVGSNDLHQNNTQTKETLLLESKLNELNKQVNELTKQLSNENNEINNDKNNIGFTILKTSNNDTQNNNNDNRITKIVVNKNNDNSNENRITKIVNITGICQNCSCTFTKNHKKQIYCSENCRVQAWQNRTGKTLRKNKKS